MTPLVVIVAGFAAIGAGLLLIRAYGPRARVGRLLVVTPAVTIAEARSLAVAGRPRYVRIDGRIDADDEFPDEHERPLVLRRRRIDARLAGGWRTLEDRREEVPFRVREGLDEIEVDSGALDAGLVTLARESAGTAGDVGDRLPRKLDPATPVRLRLEQLSTVDHVSVLGVPLAGASGAIRMTAGTGRPLIVSTLAAPEAMRVLAAGNRARPLAAALALFGGMIILTIGIGWALIGGTVT